MPITEDIFQGGTFQLTNAGGLCSTPGAVVLTISPHRADQNERRVAGEGDRGQEGEASVLPPALARYPWIPAEHGWKDTEARKMQDIQPDTPCLYDIPWRFSI